jgi:hypothetical protein
MKGYLWRQPRAKRADELDPSIAAAAASNVPARSSVASWQNMIRLGAGATAEAWDPSLKNNLTFSHPWAASPAFVVPAGSSASSRSTRAMRAFA